MTASDNHLPGIKQLIWEVDFTNGQETRFVDTIVGRYLAWEDKGSGHVLIPDATYRGLITSRKMGATIDEAIAYAQADFESKIRSVLA